MLSKIADALARVLDPIRPIARPGAALSTSKSSEGGEGGYGTLGYEKPPEAEKSLTPEGDEAPLAEEGLAPESTKKPLGGLPFQPGLTQVILDLSAARTERSGSAAQTYENGAKDQKKNARLPKGSMLDKKAG
jgi:hypothetical protein